MDQTQELSPLKVLPENPVEVTEELVKEFKGRIPSGIKPQIDAYKKEKKRSLLVERKKKREEKMAVYQEQRVDAFLAEFVKNGGNATQAAMDVFNCKSRSSAASVGSFYLKKAKVLGRLYMESKGYSYGRLLTILLQKAESSHNPAFFDRAWEIGGYGSFRDNFAHAPITTVNIVQSEKDIFKKYSMGVEEGEVVTESDNEEEEDDN